MYFIGIHIILIGLESVGVPMTATLIAELIILAIGDAMRIPIVSDFCLFARIALIVGYLLEMTFFMAVLAINIKCVEVRERSKKKKGETMVLFFSCITQNQVWVGRK